MFRDQAEFRAQRRQNTFVADWEIWLDKFLTDQDLPLLNHMVLFIGFIEL
jgi:hypothetical protein